LWVPGKTGAGLPYTLGEQASVLTGALAVIAPTGIAAADYLAMQDLHTALNLIAADRNRQ
jgi:hypothetical protein